MSSILLSCPIILEPFITWSWSHDSSVEAGVTSASCWCNTNHFSLPLIFPQAKQFPFLSSLIYATIFCPFYLLRETWWFIPEHWADTCKEASKRMLNIFMPTACGLSQTSQLFKVSSLTLHPRVQITEPGQQLLHDPCPSCFWPTNVILHFLSTPAQINT